MGGLEWLAFLSEAAVRRKYKRPDSAEQKFTTRFSASKICALKKYEDLQMQSLSPPPNSPMSVIAGVCQKYGVSFV